MIIRELNSQIKEHYKQSNNALLLTGARQVGKSYAIRKYGTSNYTSFVEINFIEQPQAETDIQKLTDKNIEEIDKILAVKETEIMSI